MKLSGLLLAAGLAAPSLGLTVRVQSDITEDSGSATARFLQGIADYKPEAFHPFLRSLVDNKFKPSRVELSHPKFQSKKGLDGKNVKSPYTDGSINPLFTPFVRPNETAALLEQQLHRYRHLRGRGEMDLLKLAIAAGQSDEVVDLMQGVWRRREAEIAESTPSARTCNSWIDVRGTKACNSGQFWQAVGREVKQSRGPIQMTGSGAALLPLPLDTLLPSTHNASLPFFVLYATPIDEDFPPLYDLLHKLAASLVNPPRLQFAVRWKPDNKGEQTPKSLPHFSASLEVKEGSIPALSSADAAQLGLRATAHILNSDDPLATFASVAATVPVLASKLTTVAVPDNFSDIVEARSLKPSFTINGIRVPEEEIEAFALIRRLRAERSIVTEVQHVNVHLSFKAARDMIMAKGLSGAEEVAGQNDKNLVKPSPSNPLKIVNLADALKGLPPLFVHGSFMDGVNPDEADSEETLDPPAFTSIYVVADLDSVKGRKLAQEALKHLDSRAGVRVSFVHNPSELSIPEHPYHFSTLLHALIAGGEFHEVFPAELSGWLTANIDKAGPKKPLDDLWSAENPITPFVEGATAEQQEAAVSFWKSIAPFAERAGVKAGASAIIINGRVIELKGTPFLSNQFRSLHDYEWQKRIQPIVNVLQVNVPEQIATERRALAHIASVITSIISGLSFPVGSTPRSRSYADLPSDYPSFTAGLTEDNSLFEIGVVVDPVSELAQKWAPILQALSTVPQVFVRVYLAPSPHNVPATSLHSVAFRSQLGFDAQQNIVKPSIKFEGIPAEAIVSLKIDVNDYGDLKVVSGKEVKETKATELPSEVVYEFKWGPGPREDEPSPVEAPSPIPVESPRVKDEL